MKLKVLGSGNIYSSSEGASYLIDDEILIDAPGGISKSIFDNINNINNILLTHMHGDHYFDIPFILLKRIKNKCGKATIYGDESTKEKIYDITKLAFPNKVDAIDDNLDVNTNKVFELNNYEVKKIRLEHSEDIESYGYVLSNDKVKVGFTGDTCVCRGLTKLIKECNKVIIECSNIEGNKSDIGINDIEKIVKKYPTCIFYTTHMANKTKEELKKLKFINLIVLNDGDEFNF